MCINVLPILEEMLKIMENTENMKTTWVQFLMKAFKHLRFFFRGLGM